MADTIGSLVDKLATVNNKLFMKQELIYEIKRMSFAEFVARFAPALQNHEMLQTGMRQLYDSLHALSDLNVQRNQLMSEVDLGIIALIKRAIAGEELDDGRSVQRAHKTMETCAASPPTTFVVAACRECGKPLVKHSDPPGIQTSGKMCCVGEALRLKLIEAV